MIGLLLLWLRTTIRTDDMTMTDEMKSRRAMEKIADTDLNL